MDVFFMRDHGAMYPPDIFERGEYYRLITCMFLHFGAEHLLFNMLLLLFAGDMLETRMGPVRYLLIYLGGGVAGNLLSLFIAASSGDYAVSAGASGGIFAVIGALVWIVIVNKGKTTDIDGKGLYAMAVLSLIQGFWETGTDNFAHLGGFICGFLLAAILGIVSFPNSRRKV
ncbi:MAG: rhomboid family intramembrane serine protease [Eubacteriales bacterium]|nr:rhomboid family intramembrane serine protease [Eubacteriales bacterium]